MRGPRGGGRGSGGAVAGGLDAQSRTQAMLDNWGRDPAKEAAENAERDRREKLRKSNEEKEIQKSLQKLKAKEALPRRDEASQKEVQRRESQRLAIQKEERERRDRLSKENLAFQAKQAEERAKVQAEEKARREAEEKARREAEEKAQELGKRKREEEQDNFLTNSWKNVAQWASSLRFNSGEALSLPDPFAPKASAPTSSLANSPPLIREAPIIQEYEQRPTKKQKTDIEPIQMPRSTPTPSDYGQHYLDGLYKRFNNGDNNFNIRTIIREKDMSVMRGNEQNRVSYLNQRVAKWEIELSKFGITQTAPKKIQTDDVVDLKGNKIKRDDYLIQYGDYLKENIKTLKNEATNNSGSEDRNNKLNHLIAFHYLELAKMVCAGSNGLHDNLTDIPSQYKGFLEYSVGDSKFISTDLIQEPISMKTTDLGSRARRDIIYLEEDIYKDLTGKKTNICTLSISVPFDPGAYRNQVTKITQRISSDDKTSQRKSPQQKLDELKERSQEDANRVSLAERFLPSALLEIVSSKSHGQQKQAPFPGVFKRAAPASMSFTQEDARDAHLQPPSGLGYRHSSIYVNEQNQRAAKDLSILQQLYGSKVGMAMFTDGAQVPGASGRGGSGRGGGR